MVESKYSFVISFFLIGIFLYTSYNNKEEHIKKDYLELDKLWIELDTFTSDSNCMEYCTCDIFFTFKNNDYKEIEILLYENGQDSISPGNFGMFDNEFMFGGGLPDMFEISNLYVSISDYYHKKLLVGDTDCYPEYDVDSIVIYLEGKFSGKDTVFKAKWINNEDNIERWLPD